MEQYRDSQYDDDLTIGDDDYNAAIQTDEFDLFEFGGDDDSPISRLKTLVLSIDWEITDEVLLQFNEEILDLKDIWAADKIRMVYLQALEKISKYIYQNKADAHPNAIKLLLSMYYNLERIVLSEDLSDADKKKILLEDVRRFERLKKLITSTPKKEGHDEVSTTTAAQSVASDVEGEEVDVLMDLKAIVLGIDWEITEKDLLTLRNEVLHLEEVFRDSRPKLVFLQGIRTLGAYIRKKRSNSHADAFKLLHSFYDGLEKLASNQLTMEEEKRILFPEVEKFNRFKQIIATTITTEALEKTEEEPEDDQYLSDDVAPAFADMPVDGTMGFQEDVEAEALGVEAPINVDEHISRFFEEDETPQKAPVAPAIEQEVEISSDDQGARAEADAFSAAFFDTGEESPGTFDVDKETALQGVNVETDADDDSAEEALPFDANGELAPALADDEQASVYSEIPEGEPVSEVDLSNELSGRLDDFFGAEGEETSEQELIQQETGTLFNVPPEVALQGVDVEADDDEEEEVEQDESAIAALFDEYDTSDIADEALVDHTEQVEAKISDETEQQEDLGPVAGMFEEDAGIEEEFGAFLDEEAEFEESLDPEEEYLASEPLEEAEIDVAESETLGEPAEEFFAAESLDEPEQEVAEAELQSEFDDEFVADLLEQDEAAVTDSLDEPAEEFFAAESLDESEQEVAEAELQSEFDDEFVADLLAQDEAAVADSLDEPAEEFFAAESLDESEQEVAEAELQSEFDDEFVADLLEQDEAAVTDSLDEPAEEFFAADSLDESEQEVAEAELQSEFDDEFVADLLEQDEAAVTDSLEDSTEELFVAESLDEPEQEITEDELQDQLEEEFAAVFDQESTEEIVTADEPAEEFLAVEDLGESEEEFAEAELQETLAEEIISDAHEEEERTAIAEAIEDSEEELQLDEYFEESPEALVAEEISDGFDETIPLDENILDQAGVEINGTQVVTSLVDSGDQPLPVAEEEEEVVFELVEDDDEDLLLQDSDTDFEQSKEIESDESSLTDDSEIDLLGSDAKEPEETEVEFELPAEEATQELQESVEAEADEVVTDEEVLSADITEGEPDSISLDEGTPKVSEVEESYDTLAPLKECVQHIGIDMQPVVIQEFYKEINTLRQRWVEKPVEKSYLQLLSTIAQHIERFSIDADPESHNILQKTVENLETVTAVDGRKAQELLMEDTCAILLWQQNLVHSKMAATAADKTLTEQAVDRSYEQIQDAVEVESEHSEVQESPADEDITPSEELSTLSEELEESFDDDFAEEMENLLEGDEDILEVMQEDGPEEFDDDMAFADTLTSDGVVTDGDDPFDADLEEALNKEVEEAEKSLLNKVDNSQFTDIVQKEIDALRSTLQQEIAELRKAMRDDPDKKE